MIRPTGILGGAQANHHERRAAVEKLLANRPVVDFGLRWQCRCGGIRRVLWRRRWCCPTCGRWIHDTTVDRRLDEIGGPDPRDAVEVVR